MIDGDVDTFLIFFVIAMTREQALLITNLFIKTDHEHSVITLIISHDRDHER